MKRWTVKANSLNEDSKYLLLFPTVNNFSYFFSRNIVNVYTVEYLHPLTLGTNEILLIRSCSFHLSVNTDKKIFFLIEAVSSNLLMDIYC